MLAYVLPFVLYLLLTQIPAQFPDHYAWMTGPLDAAVEGRGTSGYEQPLKPSEYLQRQVRVAALASTDRLETVRGDVPSELVIFSSDYPHPEGTRHPFRVFDEQLQDAGDDLRAQFYGGSISQLIEL